jgi:hypothetical protein
MRDALAQRTQRHLQKHWSFQTGSAHDLSFLIFGLAKDEDILDMTRTELTWTKLIQNTACHA